MFSALVEPITAPIWQGHSSPTSVPGCSGWRRTGWCSSSPGARPSRSASPPACSSCRCCCCPPTAGLIADRFNKQQILMVTQSWLALCAAALGVLAVTGVATTEQVYLIAFAFGLGTAFDNPARQSFVSEVAGPDHLPNAIGLNSATFHGARIVGPALAGLVIAAGGIGLGDPVQRAQLPGLHRRLVDHGQPTAAHRPTQAAGQAAAPRGSGVHPQQPRHLARVVRDVLRRHLRLELPDDQCLDGAAGVSPQRCRRTGSSARSWLSAPWPVL